MKKIPTLFKRDPDDMKRVLPELAVKLPPDAIATAKFDGSAVMYDGHDWWKRREVKAGKTPPPEFVEADFDEVTGKRQGWVPITDGREDRWFREAIDNGHLRVTSPGTYEAVGPHFQGNPHNFAEDTLVRHGSAVWNEIPIDYEVIARNISDFPYEGLVWWVDGESVAKIKRRDFGHPWPVEAK